MIICAIALTRACSTFDPFPGWSGDPLAMPAPIIGITPVISLAMDAATLLAGSLILLKGSPSVFVRVGLVLLMAGAGAAALHARPDQHDSLDNFVIGASWVAALGGAIALRHACRHAALRTLATACLLAIIPVLAVRGGVQVFSEHPETVAEFNRNKQQFLEAQGWTAGSPPALAYERRLVQAEASAWFGLANVFASLMAGALVAFTGGALLRLRGDADEATAGTRPRIVLGVAAVLAAAGLVLAGAKGGYAAAFVGFGALTVVWVRPSLSARLGGWLAVSAVFAALLAVVCRGVVGERIGELSIYFRWMYMQGAARIFAAHPWLGVGPAGFKDAYMLAKPAISPEDVASPHSVLLDYAATLGIGGVCLGGLWLGLVFSAGRGLFTPAAPDASDARRTMQFASFCASAAILASAWLERPLATPESTFMRLIGLAGAVAVVWAVVRTASGRSNVMWPAVAAAAVALAAHAQIEMTMITSGSGPWIALLLAVAAPAVTDTSAPVRRHSPAALATCGLCAAIIAMLPGVVSWERALRSAYDSAARVAEFMGRAQNVLSGAARDDSPAQLAADLSAATNQTVAAEPRAIAAATERVRETGVNAAREQLEAALQAQPNHFPTARSLSRLCLQQAQSMATGADKAKLIDRGVRVSLDAAAKHGGGAAAWAWLATAREAAGKADPDRNEQMGQIDALAAAAALAPHEPTYQVRLARAYQAKGSAAQAKEWAARALATDRDLRLDPLRQLTSQEREEMKRLSP